MSDVIPDHGETSIAYMGDGIMATAWLHTELVRVDAMWVRGRDEPGVVWSVV